jgi:hypothetical protein
MGNPTAANLVAAWIKDDLSGGSTDSHGSFTLTANLTPGSASGRVNNARTYTQANERHEISAQSEFNPLAEHSITFVFKSAEIATPDITIWESERTTGGAKYQIYLNNTNLHYSESGTPANGVTLTGATGNNTWYFLACGYDGSAFWGSLGGAAKTMGGSVASVSDTASLKMGAVGAISDTITLDQVYYWSDTLSDAEISWLFNSGSIRALVEITGSPSTPNAAETTGILLSGL